MPAPRFAVGDRVAYSVDFLRSTGQTTGDVPFLRGTVVEVRRLGDNDLVHVRWDGGMYGSREVVRVIAPNLAHVGPNARFCAC